MKWILFALALVGCAPTFAEVDGPDGGMMEVTCYEGMRDCYNGAARHCGGKYHVIGQDQGEETAVVMTNGYGGAFVATDSEDHLYFRCGEKPTH